MRANLGANLQFQTLRNSVHIKHALTFARLCSRCKAVFVFWVAIKSAFSDLRGVVEVVLVDAVD